MADFQAAAQAVVDGDIESLKAFMHQEPALVMERSPKHGATLLHYIGANGPVEDEMQKTPNNAVDIAAFLLANGCDVDATIDGEPASTPLVSLVTSEFPALAGVQGQLVELFLKSGAAVNGLKDDGYPLACALCFQYPDAIDTLVNNGARVDNLVVAASLGRVEFVKSCFDSDSKLLSNRTGYPDPFMRSFEPNQIIELALEQAAIFEQHEVSEYLASKVDIDD